MSSDEANLTRQLRDKVAVSPLSEVLPQLLMLAQASLHLSMQAGFFYGGGGDRTRVPRCLCCGIYVCSRRFGCRRRVRLSAGSRGT